MNAIRRTITKDGVSESLEPLKQDYEDVCTLLAADAWQRYFVRKLKEQRADLVRELETLESPDISEFRKRQAKIELLDEICVMPERDLKNLRRD